MALGKTLGEYDPRSYLGNAPPRLLLVWLSAAFAAAFSLLVWLLPPPLVLPAFSLLSLAGAAIAALSAWWSRVARRSPGVTAWDVAGALALIGFAAALLGEPDHVASLSGAR